MKPRGVLLLAALATLTTACGIRATQVPTDVGPAPSKAACSLSATDIGPQAGNGVHGIPVQVFLLCDRQLVPVDRAVHIPEDSVETARRVLMAQELLDELSGPLTSAESRARYDTEVRAGLTVTGPLAEDPEDALRLSTRPEDLSSYALAQIICTFADSTAAEGDGSVTLGGPGTEPLRRYRCTTELRSDPGAKTPPSTEVEKS
ncbi:hypothetical protein [Streptomyces sp. NPDC002845]